MCSGIGIIYYAFATREQFYPAMTFLVGSKEAALVAGNMVFCLALILARMFMSIFLGTLRDPERELLYENLKYELTEIFFAIAIFRNEMNATVRDCSYHY